MEESFAEGYAQISFLDNSERREILKNALILACERDDIDRVRFLLSIPEYFPCSKAIVIACKNENHEIIELLSGRDYYDYDEYIFDMDIYKNRKVVSLIIENTNLIHSGFLEDFYRYSSPETIHHVCQNYHLDTDGILIDLYESEDKDDYPAIFNLIYSGVEFQQFRHEEPSCTSLFEAIARDGRIELLEYLVDRGIDLNNEDTTMLMYACEHSKPDMIRRILYFDNDINAISRYGESALTHLCKNMSCESDLLDIAATLLESSNYRNKNLFLLEACRKDLSLFVREALKHDVNIYVRDSEYNTPLSLAFNNENDEMITCLLENESDFEEREEIIAEMTGEYEYKLDLYQSISII